LGASTPWLAQRGFAHFAKRSYADTKRIKRSLGLGTSAASRCMNSSGDITRCFAFGVTPVHAVQHQAVKVNVEIGRRAKALDQRDRAAVGLVGLQPGLIEQEARDGAVHHLQHGDESGARRGATAAPALRWRPNAY
jgi:hypothetical protein